MALLGRPAFVVAVAVEGEQSVYVTDDREEAHRVYERALARDIEIVKETGCDPASVALIDAATDADAFIKEMQQA